MLEGGTIVLRFSDAFAKKTSAREASRAHVRAVHEIDLRVCLAAI